MSLLYSNVKLIGDRPQRFRIGRMGAIIEQNKDNSLQFTAFLFKRVHHLTDGDCSGFTNWIAVHAGADGRKADVLGAFFFGQLQAGTISGLKGFGSPLWPPE